MNRSKDLVVESRSQHAEQITFWKNRASRMRGVLFCLPMAALMITACGDFHLSANSLQLTPNPAGPGDVVVASFILNLIPTQEHTIAVLINDAEHMRVTRSGQPPIPVDVVIGDAADLIEQYGTGEHVVRIEVRANEENEITRTAPASLELEDSTS